MDNVNQQLQPNNAPRPLAQITAAQFGAKFQGKREVYRFLTHDCGAYLSSYETMSIFHMRDLVANKRRMIKSANVKHVIIPQFEGLSIKDLLEYSLEKQDVMVCLPMVKTEIKRLPR